MTEVVLTFTVPAECRALFAHELELLQYSAEPLIAWLERHGGGMQIEG